MADRKRHPLYEVWRNMRARCSRPHRPDYARYGGRGIRVCDRWKNSFADFLADVGDRPTSLHQLDRIDNYGNYEPGNVRWATAKEQNRNRRDTVFVEFNGDRFPLSELAEDRGIKPDVFGIACLNSIGK